MKCLKYISSRVHSKCCRKSGRTILQIAFAQTVKWGTHNLFHCKYYTVIVFTSTVYAPGVWENFIIYIKNVDNYSCTVGQHYITEGNKNACNFIVERHRNSKNEDRQTLSFTSIERNQI